MNPHVEIFLGDPREMDLAKLVQKNLRAVVKHRELRQPQLVALGIATGTAHRATSLRDEKAQNLRLETLEQIAKALNIPAWLLLIPNLIPDSPPHLVTEAVYREEVRRRVQAMLDRSEQLEWEPKDAEPRIKGSPVSGRMDREDPAGKPPRRPR